MNRISVVEQYDNKDLIQQIYRLKNLVETGTAADIQITASAGVTTVTITKNDDTVETFNLPSDYVTQVTSSQSGTLVTLNFVYASGLTDTITFNGSAGDVSATPDTIAVRDSSARVHTADVPSGDSSDNAANTKFVDAALNNYAPMMRTSGNQTYTGVKTCERNAATTSSGASSPLVDKFLNVDMSQPITVNRYAFFPMLVDANGNIVGGIRVQLSSGNHVVFSLFTSKNDGTRVAKLLAEYDRTNDVWL